MKATHSDYRYPTEQLALVVRIWGLADLIKRQQILSFII